MILLWKSANRRFWGGDERRLFCRKFRFQMQLSLHLEIRRDEATRQGAGVVQLLWIAVEGVEKVFVMIADNG